MYALPSEKHDRQPAASYTDTASITGTPPFRPSPPTQINSARPDGVYWCPEKTPCIGVGLRSIFDQVGPGATALLVCAVAT